MKSKSTVLLLSLGACTLLGACHFLDSSAPQLAPDIPSEPDTETFAPALGVTVSSMDRTTDGVYYSDKQIGTGAQLDSATAVIIDYAIYLKDGTFIASNVQTGVDMHTFVPGFVEGMLGLGATGAMREGGVRLIVVPSELAYANIGKGKIPPNATLVFSVALDQIP